MRRISRNQARRRQNLLAGPARHESVRTELLEPRLMFAVHNDSFDVTDLTQLRSDPTYSAITGKGIAIAVLDTGIDALNPDFTGKVLAFYNAVEDAVPSTISASSVNSAVDNDGHGTHVSGIAASSDPNIGVADGASLVDVKVIADSGESQLGGDPLLRGLEFVEDFASQFNIKVVNMSLGEATSSGGVNDNTVPQADDISQAIQTLEGMGITVVAAAGNSYANDPVPGESYPAVVSTISVANVWSDSGAGYDFDTYSYGTQNDTWAATETSAAPDQFSATSQRSTLSNQVVAPGMNVISDWNGTTTDDTGSNDLLNTLSGTSMASPFISGTVALMQQAALTYGGEYLSPEQILTTIKATATQIDDPTIAGDGRVQISDGQLVSSTVQPLPGTNDTFDLVNVLAAIQAVQAKFTGQTSNTDINNTIASATVVSDLNGTQDFTDNGNIGSDGLNDVGPNDIDLYKIVLDETGTLTAALSQPSGGAAFDATVRLFDSSGNQIQIVEGTSSAGYPTLTTAAALAVGTYYIGITSVGNNTYNITDGSGATGGVTTGDYSVTFSLTNPDPNGVPSGAVFVDLTDPNVTLPGNTVANEFDGDLGSDPPPTGSTTRVPVPNGDVDMFQVVAPDTGVVTADVSATQFGFFAGSDSYVEVLNSNLSVIASNGQLSNFASNAEVQFPVTIGSTYYIAVTVASNANFNPTDPFGRATGSTASQTEYLLDISFNNGNTDGTALLANTENVGTTVNGSITSTNSSFGANGGFKYVDWYTYTTGAAGLLDLSATATSSGFSPNVQLWTLTSSNGQVTGITEIGSTTGSGTPLIDQLAAGTTVYVSVTGAGNSNFNWFSLGSGSGGETGSYSLKSSLLPTSQLKSLNDSSIDNGTPQTITTGQIVTGNIGQYNGLIIGDTDVDLYKFTPTTTGLYDIRTDTSAEGSANTLLRLFDSNGNQLAENDNATNTTTASFIRTTLTAGQTYYIGVSGSGNSAYNPLTGAGATDGQTGTYVLTANIAVVPAVSVAAPSEIQEPNPGETAAAVFTISMDETTTAAVTIDYATADGSALAGQDYTTTSGSVTFQPGQTSATVSVPVLYDANSTASQTFFLNLSTTDPSVVISGGQAQATITNLPVTQHTFNAKTPATYTDTNGHVVTVRLLGQGSGDVSVIGDDASSVQITLDQTTTNSILSITAAGEPTTTLTMLQINGSLAVLSAKQVELQGDLTITGTVQSLTLGGASGGHTLSILGTGKNGTIVLGHVSDMTVTADEPLASIVATNWLSTDGSADVISAPSLKLLRTTGDFAASLALSATGKMLDTVKIGGALGDSQATWNIAGPVGTITAGSIAAGWNGSFATSINDLTVLGDQSGTLTADSIGAWNVRGNLDSAAIMLNPSEKPVLNSLHVDGLVDDSDLNLNGEVRSITVGAMTDSNIFAGVESAVTTLPDETSNFVTEPSADSVPEILTFTVTGLPDSTFAVTDSNIAAMSLGRVILRKIDTDNSGTSFGLAAESLKSFTDIEPGKKTVHWTDNQNQALLPSSGDFRINVV